MLTVLAVALVIVALPLLVLVLLPSTPPAVWLSTQLVVAQALAFPRAAAIGCLVIAAALVLPVLTRLSQRRRFRAGQAALVAWLVLALMLALDVPGPAPSTSPSAGGGERLTLVTWNSMDTVAPGDLRQLASIYDPDVIVLPEGGSVRDEARGTPFADREVQTPDDGWAAGYVGEVAPTTILSHERLGMVARQAAPATTFGSVGVRLAKPSPVTVIGAHTAPPLPSLMGRWRDDLNRLATLDAPDDGPLILAGDLNATLRHGPLARRQHLVDAAQQCGRPDGTWPVKVPSWLRTPIDHVLVTPDVRVVRCQTATVGAGDHQALVVVLELPKAKH